MKFETELEIFRNGILSGDIEDCMGRVRKDIEESSRSNNEKGKLIHNAFTQIKAILCGNAKPEDFLKGLSERETFLLFRDRREIDEILKEYRYALAYSIDRYNVRYPHYDGKRCGDL